MTSLPFSRTALGMTLAATLSMMGCSQSEPEPAAAAAGGEAPAEAAAAGGHGGAKTVTGGEPFHGVLEYRSKDAKLAIVRPTLVPASEANLPGGVSVVGVSVGGEARAYPLYLLRDHQIVNDRVGGQPIAASW